MTSSAKCHKCDRIAYHFCYHDGKVDINDGFWHCPDHGPVYSDTTGPVEIEVGTTDSTYANSVPGYEHMSRRDRRALIHQLKKGRK